MRTGWDRDYDVWYGGRIIGNLKAVDDEAAQIKVKEEWKGGKQGKVTVKRTQ